MKKLLITITLFSTLVGSVFAFPREYTLYDGTQLVDIFTADVEDIKANLAQYDWVLEVENEDEKDATYYLALSQRIRWQEELNRVTRAIQTTKVYQTKMRIQRDMEVIKTNNNIK